MTGDDLEVQLSAPVEIKPDTLVNLDDTGAVSVTGESVEPGRFARITLEFESGQETEVNVPVVALRGRVRRDQAGQPEQQPQHEPQRQSERQRHALSHCVGMVVEVGGPRQPPREVTRQSPDSGQIDRVVIP